MADNDKSEEIEKNWNKIKANCSDMLYEYFQEHPIVYTKFKDVFGEIEVEHCNGTKELKAVADEFSKKFTPCVNDQDNPDDLKTDAITFIKGYKGRRVTIDEIEVLLKFVPNYLKRYGADPKDWEKFIGKIIKEDTE